MMEIETEAKNDVKKKETDKLTIDNIDKGDETSEKHTPNQSDNKKDNHKDPITNNNTLSHQTSPTLNENNDSNTQKTILNNSTNQQKKEQKSPPITGSETNSPKDQDMLTLKLREVFDVCDAGNQGFISVDHFLELAKEFATVDKQYDDKVIF